MLIYNTVIVKLDTIKIASKLGFRSILLFNYLGS